MVDSAASQPFRLMLCQKTPMRDGVNLSADVYLPNPSSPSPRPSPFKEEGAAAGSPSPRPSPFKGEGVLITPHPDPLPHGERGQRYPALLLRTIYHNKDPRYLRWAAGFVQAGYAVVLQDCRGRHDSDGVWDPYVCEVNDGVDTHEWVASQPWCDGQVATFGVSYPGCTQTCAAPSGSKHLKALVPIASQQDNYGHHRCDGAIAWANTAFFANMMGRTMQTEALAQLDMQTVWQSLPLVSAWDGVGDCPYFRGVVEHEAYDKWWSNYSLRQRYGQVDAPAYFMTGWYDSLMNETLKVFNGWRAQARSADARRQTKILIGPWSHQVAPWGRPQAAFQLGPNGEFDDVSFGREAWLDIVQEHLRWYDARLKGVKNGMDEGPPIRLFVMGENRWRSENEWPLARTRWKEFYLHAGRGPDALEGERQHGRLSEARSTGDEQPDRFRYDPDDPAPTWGGSYQMKDFGGPKDRREVEKRGDVLLFTSAPLDRDLEVTGPVTATIFAESSATDTDFTAALIDLHPDGRAILLTDGICRARFRAAAAGWTTGDLKNGTGPYDALYDPSFKPELMTPGTPYEFKIDMWATSNLFKAGHRIRVEISSSNFPRYDRNLNTGGRVGFDTARRVAHQTVFHDAARPSRVTLPVIPR